MLSLYPILPGLLMSLRAKPKACPRYCEASLWSSAQPFHLSLTECIFPSHGSWLFLDLPGQASSLPTPSRSQLIRGGLPATPYMKQSSPTFPSLLPGLTFLKPFPQHVYLTVSYLLPSRMWASSFKFFVSQPHSQDLEQRRTHHRNPPYSWWVNIPVRSVHTVSLSIS